MNANEFDYSFIESTCADIKIVFITDEKSTAVANSGVHMHSFWELFFLQEGNLTITADNEKYILSKNQAIIIPPNIYHSTEFNDKVEKVSVFFAFEKVKKQNGEKLFDEMYHSFSNCGFHRIEDTYIGRTLNLISENILADKLGKLWRIKSYVTELIFYLYDCIKDENTLSPDSQLTGKTYWVYKYAIDRLLDLHYMNDISLEALSDKLFVSPQTVTRIISSAYGKSFNELKLELKMRNAKKLLRETEMTVFEIGKCIGYTSSRGFLSAFSKYEGCTPSLYRQKHKKRLSQR